MRVAVDTGGTFTDVAVRRPDGSVEVWKVSSSPRAPDDAVVGGVEEALERAGAGFGSVERFVHGTTVATNTLLTRTGARVGLVTTAGFADMLHIGHQSRPALYDLSVRRPAPLVPHELTWEVTERLAADGSVLVAPAASELDGLAERIRGAAPEVVVVSLLNAYVDPAHEQLVVEHLRRAGAAPSVLAATSVTPEMREYERTSTAVISGYVQPAIADYLERLETRLAERAMPARLWVMQSNGGLLGAGSAREHSVRTVLSGLVGGVIGAARWAAQLGLPQVVSFDIGGTSTDIALIRNGVPGEMTSGELEGYPLRMPAVDVHTIGAGGGSIAWRDAGGSLRVGPQSAGARPGPVCYGLGGAQITVTDAHALLGRLGTSLLGGRLALDLDRARERLTAFAGELGLDEDETAAGVLRVITATMARGVRKVSIERGIDPRDCVLMAFGGAGPLHATDLIRELGMKGAVVPPHPGIASAVGMLDAPIRHDFAAAATATSAAELDTVARTLDVLTADAIRFLEERERVDPALVTADRLVDARYLGQSYDLTVPWQPDFAALRKTFDNAHLERYGFDDPDAVLEIVAVRASAVVEAAGAAELPRTVAEGAPPEPVATRSVRFGARRHDCPLYRRDDVPAGVELAGPLVFEQLDSTVVVAPGQVCHHDTFGFLHIHEERP
ncbi:hydantoinase/oxoprolinase family protein [Pseudonocardia sp. RS11V-5]|uniref:hydantoinase/oxoprolinase family protein n=1 Tax=Pseudonocardia terrae TaxID=2905831 RepID=UPI001E45664F|nr:hydantoinase/oxoprolinase family protein [Pseudonocardia terrae]MCE3552749.1 hydantoinase/oxoprolinase family protein [Pseudonocardia terrae]